MTDYPILIGDSEPVMVELIAELITEVIGEDNRVAVYSSGYGEDLRQLAENHDVRLFCLTINNLLFRSNPAPYEKRIEKVIELVSEMKRRYEIPVIISGAKGILIETVWRSEADAVIETPFNLDDYRAILKDSYKTPFLIADNSALPN